MILAMREMSSRLRLAALLWGSIWMLVVPLFHVHPRADHHHGEAGHVHGGTVHTVWSPDLDDEYDHHHMAHHFGHTASSQYDVSLHSTSVTGLDELAFILLVDSTKQKLPKLIDPLLLAEESVTRVVSTPSGSRAYRTESPPRHTFFTRVNPTRAPPSLSV